MNVGLLTMNNPITTIFWAVLGLLLTCCLFVCIGIYYGGYIPLNLTKPTGIFEGKKVRPHSHPYQVWIKSMFEDGDGTSFKECGGVVITKNNVLTTASCVNGAEYIQIIFGAGNIKEAEETQDYRWSTTVHIHKVLAIITFYDAITYNEFIQPVRLPFNENKNVDLTGKNLKLVGWTSVTKLTGRELVLYKSMLRILSKDQCREIFKIFSKRVSLCSLQDYRSPCNGYYGGALIFNNILYGLTSCIGNIQYGMRMPSAFARITDYEEFISSFLNY